MKTIIKNSVKVALTPRGGDILQSLIKIEDAEKVVVNTGGGMGGGRHEILTNSYTIDGSLMSVNNIVTGEVELIGVGALAYIEPISLHIAVVDNTVNASHHDKDIIKSTLTTYIVANALTKTVVDGKNSSDSNVETIEMLEIII